MLPTRFTLLAPLLIVLAGCLHSDDSGQEDGKIPGSNDEPGGGTAQSDCEDSRPGFKNVYFGDLHTHTSYSLDAYFFNALTDPRIAHRFARGLEPLPLPAAGSQDVFTRGREITIDRPLDFNAVTDHAEFLGGFYLLCDNSDQTQQLCDQAVGQGVRDDIRAIAAGDVPFQTLLAQSLINQSPTDMVAWELTKQINDEEYEPCHYTTLHGYEYSSNELSQMFHRNVIFKGPTEAMPKDVLTSFKPTTATLPENGNDDWELFDHLTLHCVNVPGCEVLTIPHSANRSDGRMYLAAGEDAGMTVIGDLSGVPLGRKVEFTSVYFPMTAEDAALRQSMDRSFEITQHKGQSECAIGLEGEYLDSDEGFDPKCVFEVDKTVCRGLESDPPACAEFCTGDPLNDPHFCSYRTPPNNLAGVCVQQGPDGASRPPEGGNSTGNCAHPLDYYRNAMAEGLRIRQTLGVNPYKANITASLDTHNGDSGNAQEWPFQGHGGVLDDEPRELLGFWGCDNEDAGEDPADPGNCSNRTFVDFARALNPGGLAGVWAEQNTRGHIWDAVHRGESFGTSGPRIRVRSIASWDPLPGDICQRLAGGRDLIGTAEVQGARMGGDLPPPPSAEAVPHFAVWAQQDPEGRPLQQVDIIKGHINAQGEPRLRVFASVAQTRAAVSLPDRNSCAVPVDNHPESFCVQWSDQDFDAGADAFWYARVLEVPSCRWSAWMCHVENDVDCAQLDPANGMFAEDSGMRGFEGCCTISGEPGSFAGIKRFDTIEERAWASPIWYERP